jgi:hypothetical protein
MARTHHLIVAALLCTPLSGCDRGVAGCTTVETWSELEATTPVGAAHTIPSRVIADWCVKRAAYLMARSSDPAPTVAKAVTAACEDPISGIVREDYASMAKAVPSMSAEEYDRWTRDNYEKSALARVVEARANKCWKAVRGGAGAVDYNVDFTKRK